MLLSDPEISDSEFRSVKSWLEKEGLRSLLRDAEEIRGTLRAYQTHSDQRNKRSSDSGDDAFVDEINELLRVDAGLTARDALEFLKEWSNFGGNLPDRISFADGVTRMGNEVGKSRLLNAAHQLRNDAAKSGPGLAWPLNRG